MNEPTRDHHTNRLISAGLFDVESTTRQIPQSSAVVVVVHDQVTQAWPEANQAPPSPPSSTTNVVASVPSLTECDDESNKDNTNRYSTGQFIKAFISVSYTHLTLPTKA